MPRIPECSSGELTLGLWVANPMLAIGHSSRLPFRAENNVRIFYEVLGCITWRWWDVRSDILRNLVPYAFLYLRSIDCSSYGDGFALAGGWWGLGLDGAC